MRVFVPRIVCDKFGSILASDGKVMTAFVSRIVLADANSATRVIRHPTSVGRSMLSMRSATNRRAAPCSCDVRISLLTVTRSAAERGRTCAYLSDASASRPRHQQQTQAARTRASTGSTGEQR